MAVASFGQSTPTDTAKSEGEEGHDWQGTTVLLLTPRAQLGARRATPLIYQRHEDDYPVGASHGGCDPPGWFLNLQDGPLMAVQVKADHTLLGRGSPRSRRSRTCHAS